MEMAVIETASENSFPKLSTSVSGHLNFPRKGADRQARFCGSAKVMTGYSALPCSRSPLHDAPIRAAVLPVGTRAAIKQLLIEYYYCYLF